ncbi:hypothetical protein Tco_0672304 [Tanacetum coccineum]
MTSWSSSVDCHSNLSAVRFKRKLKHLKHNVKDWRHTINTTKTSEALDIRSRIDEIDLRAETSLLTTADVNRRINLVKALADLEHHKLKDLKQKSIGVSSSEVNSIACCCQPSQLPCTYLGLPIGANMSRTTNWSILIDRFQKRLSNWKCKTLSYGGRLTLIKSVLGSLGVYFFSIFKSPISIIKKLESIRRNFFWGGNSEEKKIAWVAWDKVIGPRDQGGLGIMSLKVFNLKWWWRFLLEENTLWRKIIVSIHGKDGGLTMNSSSPYKSGPWYQIMKLKDDISSYGTTLPSIFKRKIRNGRTTLSECAPMPHSNGTSAFVSSPVHGANINVFGPGSLSPVSHLQPPGLMFSWSWTRQPRSVVENQELLELTNLLSSLCLSNDIDTWECSISNDRLFTVKSFQPGRT